ncbi:syncytin-A-like [Geothlypis trichas]
MKNFSVSAVLTAAWMLVTVPCALGWISPQPSHNVWVTLAKTLNQDNMCLSMGSVDNPLSTCLVGIPFAADDWPVYNSELLRTTGKRPNVADTWDEWTKILSDAREEPQELDLLGSSKATYCIKFYFRRPKNDWPEIDQHKNTYRKNVSPMNKAYNPHDWCNYTARAISVSSLHPKVLPKGMFLICGDRVWAGIPSRLQGGPCTLGRLSTLTPNITLLHMWKKESESKRLKRSYTEFEENCDPKLYDWNKPKKVAVSLFLPWVAAAKALGEISHLGCWLSKQANATSAALSDLLKDEETTRQASLQNRAAIDFLLLAHGHGCEDFEGMCCFNLSSRSESIHANIQKLNDLVKDLKVERIPDWVNELFGRWGLTGWAASLVKGMLLILLVIVIVLAMFSCLVHCFRRTIVSAFFVKTESGIVVDATGPARPPWRI